MVGDINKIKTDVQQLEKQLAPIQKDNKAAQAFGRVVRELLEGVEGLINLANNIFKGEGFKWESAGERGFNKLVDQLVLVEKEIHKTHEEFNKDVGKIGEETKNLANILGKDIYGNIKAVLQDIKKSSEHIKGKKVDTENFEKFNTALDKAIDACKDEINKFEKEIREKEEAKPSPLEIKEAWATKPKKVSKERTDQTAETLAKSLHRLRDVEVKARKKDTKVWDQHIKPLERIIDDISRQGEKVSLEAALPMAVKHLQALYKQADVKPTGSLKDLIDQYSKE